MLSGEAGSHHKVAVENVESIVNFYELEFEIRHKQFVAGNVVLQSHTLLISRFHFGEHLAGLGYVAVDYAAQIGVFVDVEIESRQLKAGIVALQVGGKAWRP